VPTNLLQDFLTKPEEVASVDPPPGDKPGELGIRLFGLAGRRGPAYVDRVVASSPAAAAGIKSDDLVISLDGKAIKSGDDFQKAIANLKAGQQIQVVLKRKDDLVTVQLTAAPK
jgi:S1-C subfamily serine protease